MAIKLTETDFMYKSRLRIKQNSEAGYGFETLYYVQTKTM